MEALAYVFNVGGFKVGVVGYTLPELPTLIFPGYLDPFNVTNPTAAVNAEAAELRQKGMVSAVIALGHIGGDGAARSPTRPGALIELRRPASGRRRGDRRPHPSQYITYRPNGMLVTENPNAGQRSPASG